MAPSKTRLNIKTNRPVHPRLGIVKCQNMTKACHVLTPNLVERPVKPTYVHLKTYGTEPRETFSIPDSRQRVKPRIGGAK